MTTMTFTTNKDIRSIDKVVRLELAKFGVDVVTIQPGDFSKATHLLDRWFFDEIFIELCE